MNTKKITYKDFSKLEIKIGTVLEVEIVPDTNKLLRLVVDIGEDKPRQIVSGLRPYLTDLQELLGKQFPFLTNLEPRTICGLVSDGMILAVGDENVFAFLQLSNPVPVGLVVR